MTKNKENIKKILKNHQISADAIAEIILKNQDSVIINIDAAKLAHDDKKILKINQKIKEEIQKTLNFTKVTIIFSKDAQEAPKKQNFFKKIFKKEDPAPKAPEKKPLAKKIIAIASAKGGVGKSTFAVNFAYCLKKIGHKVALVDADIYGPSIPTLMGLEGQPEIENNLMIPKIAHGIKCASIGLMIDRDSAGVWRGPMITKILNQLINATNWQYDGQDVDYMVIDMPPGTGDVYLSLAQKFPIDGVVLISTPQSVATADVRRSVDCFQKLGVKILGLVQNMAFFQQNDQKIHIFGEDNAKKLAKELKINFLGDIAIDPAISSASEESIPITAKLNQQQIAMNYGKIAEDIVDFAS